MWHGLKAATADAYSALLNFIRSPFFFLLVGCGFIYLSFNLLSHAGACSDAPQSISCSRLGQVNLAFGLLFALLGATLTIYGAALHAVLEGQLSSVQVVYREIKAFFSSPLFFMLLGAFFIYCGLTLLDQTHSAFVFIMTILGISMILYGTGSQSVASAELPNATAGKMNIAIAGGAAALAAVFGYGTVIFSEGIQGFFKRTVDYGFLELTTRGSPVPNLNLDQHIVSASFADGRPLHTWKQSSQLQIMIPRYSGQSTSVVSVVIRDPSAQFSDPGGTPYEVNWQGVRAEPTSQNEKIYIMRMPFRLPPAETTSRDETGRPQGNFTLTPK